MNARRGDERGAVLVLTSVFMVALLAFVATALDMGNLRSTRATYQHAADTGAILSGYEVQSRSGTGLTVDQIMNAASASVMQLVQQNLGLPPSAWNNCVDVKRLPQRGTADAAIGNECISFDLTDPANPLVRVKIPVLDVTTWFGMGTAQVTAAAGADGNASVCDPLTDPAGCASSTSSSSSAPSTTRPPTSTSTPGPTTTRPPITTTTMRTPTTTRPTTSTSRPAPTTTRPVTTTTRPAPTTTRPPTTTTRPAPTTTRPAPTTTRPTTTTTTWLDLSS